MALPEALKQLPTIPQWTGLIVQVVPGDPTTPIVVEIAPDAAGVPGTWTIFDTVLSPSRSGVPVMIPLPVNAAQSWWIRARHEGSGYNPGPYTTTSRAYFAVSVSAIGMQAAIATIYPLDRTLPLGDGFFSPRADNGIGTVVSVGVTQNDGAGNRIPVKGRQTGTARHTNAITFSPAFQNPPRITLRGGILFEPRSKWGATGSGAETGAPNAALPQIEDFAALSPSASGFTVRARLRQKGTATFRSHDYPGGNNLTTAGQTTELTVANAPASTDAYTTYFQTELVLKSKYGDEIQLQITVLVEVSADSGGSWTTVESFSTQVSAEGSSTYTLTEQWVSTFYFSGLDTTDKVRIKLSVVTLTGLANTATVSVKGYDGTVGSPLDGIRYYSATDTFASKTPDADDLITWEAEDVTG